jgi:hypothetical protein
MVLRRLVRTHRISRHGQFHLPFQNRPSQNRRPVRTQHARRASTHGTIIVIQHGNLNPFHIPERHRIGALQDAYACPRALLSFPPLLVMAKLLDCGGPTPLF